LDSIGDKLKQAFTYVVSQPISHIVHFLTGEEGQRGKANLSGEEEERQKASTPALQSRPQWFSQCGTCDWMQASLCLSPCSPKSYFALHLCKGSYKNTHSNSPPNSETASFSLCLLGMFQPLRLLSNL
jgi:hypothetical protein